MAPPQLDIVPVAEKERTERQEHVVALLKEMLVDAEAGRIETLVAVVDEGEHLYMRCSPMLNRYETVGKLEWAKLTILERGVVDRPKG